MQTKKERLYKGNEMSLVVIVTMTLTMFSFFIYSVIKQLDLLKEVVQFKETTLMLYQLKHAWLRSAQDDIGTIGTYFIIIVSLVFIGSMIVFVVIQFLNKRLNEKHLNLFFVLTLSISALSSVYLMLSETDARIVLTPFDETNHDTLPMSKYQRIDYELTPDYPVSPVVASFPNESVPNRHTIPVRIKPASSDVTLQHNQEKTKLNLDVNPYILAKDGSELVANEFERTPIQLTAYNIKLPALPIDKGAMLLQNAYQVKPNETTTYTLQMKNTQNARVTLISNDKEMTMLQTTASLEPTIQTTTFTVQANETTYMNVMSDEPVRIDIKTKKK